MGQIIVKVSTNGPNLFFFKVVIQGNNYV